MSNIILAWAVHCLPLRKKYNLWRSNFDIKMSLGARTIFWSRMLLNNTCYQSLMHPYVLPNPWMVQEEWHQISYCNSCFPMFPHLPTVPFLKFVSIIYPTSAWVLPMQPGDNYSNNFLDSHSENIILRFYYSLVYFIFTICVYEFIHLKIVNDNRSHKDFQILGLLK